MWRIHLCVYSYTYFLIYFTHRFHCPERKYQPQMDSHENDSFKHKVQNFVFSSLCISSLAGTWKRIQPARERLHLGNFCVFILYKMARKLLMMMCLRDLHIFNPLIRNYKIIKKMGLTFLNWVKGVLQRNSFCHHLKTTIWFKGRFVFSIITVNWRVERLY